MKAEGLVGVIERGNLVVEVDRESSGHYTFTAMNEESAPLAIELAHLQAKSFKGFRLGIGLVDAAAEARWDSLVKELKAQERLERHGIRG